MSFSFCFVAKDLRQANGKWKLVADRFPFCGHLDYSPRQGSDLLSRGRGISNQSRRTRRPAFQFHDIQIRTDFVGVSRHGFAIQWLAAVFHNWNSNLKKGIPKFVSMPWLVFHARTPFSIQFPSSGSTLWHSFYSENNFFNLGHFLHLQPRGKFPAANRPPRGEPWIKQSPGKESSRLRCEGANQM